MFELYHMFGTTVELYDAQSGHHPMFNIILEKYNVHQGFPLEWSMYLGLHCLENNLLCQANLLASRSSLAFGIREAYPQASSEVARTLPHPIAHPTQRTQGVDPSWCQRTLALWVWEPRCVGMRSRNQHHKLNVSWKFPTVGSRKPPTGSLRKRGPPMAPKIGAWLPFGHCCSQWELVVASLGQAL